MSKIDMSSLFFVSCARNSGPFLAYEKNKQNNLNFSNSVI